MEYNYYIRVYKVDTNLLEEEIILDSCVNPACLPQIEEIINDSETDVKC